VRLKELYEQYHDQVEFIVVYVKEAHASDRWWLGRSRTQRLVNDLTGQLARTDVKEPVTLEQRRKVAASCQASLFDGVVPLYVDQMDNRVAQLYTSRPTRIYFIDRDGKVIAFLATFAAMASDAPAGPARLDGEWKLDWDRSDSFEPVMKALETPWLMRQLAGIARVGLELRAVPTPADCGDCVEKIMLTLSTPISSKEVEAILDGVPRPGEDPRGRATVDQYRWTEEEGLEMIRELELPSGSRARLREIRLLGEDPNTLLSQLTVWIDGSERASIARTFVRTGD